MDLMHIIAVAVLVVIGIFIYLDKKKG